MKTETPTIVIHIKSGCIYSAIANVEVELLVLDSDTATDETPNIPGFGNVGLDWPEVKVSKGSVRMIRHLIEVAERGYDENPNHHHP